MSQIKPPFIEYVSGYDATINGKSIKGEELSMYNAKEVDPLFNEMLMALKKMFVKLESASPELRRMVNYNEIEQAIAKAEGML